MLYSYYHRYPLSPQNAGCIATRIIAIVGTKGRFKYTGSIKIKRICFDTVKYRSFPK